MKQVQIQSLKQQPEILHRLIHKSHINRCLNITSKTEFFKWIDFAPASVSFQTAHHVAQERQCPRTQPTVGNITLPRSSLWDKYPEPFFPSRKKVYRNKVRRICKSFERCSFFFHRIEVSLQYLMSLCCGYFVFIIYFYVILQQMCF